MKGLLRILGYVIIAFAFLEWAIWHLPFIELLDKWYIWTEETFGAIAMFTPGILIITGRLIVKFSSKEEEKEPIDQLEKIISTFIISKLGSTIIKISLGTIVVLLAYFGLYANITNEIHQREVMDIRKEDNIQRLLDLSEVQIKYKAEKGYYTNNPDALTDFLDNHIVEDTIDNRNKDSIPEDMDKWNSIQNKIVRGVINPYDTAKAIYKEMGGNWKTLTEQEKIDKGYIDVNYYTALELAFPADYKKTRNNSFEIDIQNLGNIKRSYNNQKSYNNFKSEYNAYSDGIINKLEINSIYKDIHSNFNSIFDLDTNTKISTENLNSKISDNNKEIETLKSQISDKEDTKKNAQNIIRAAENQRNTYTETVGADMVIKVREKAAIKDEKGKKLKGRKKKIWDILNSQDSTEQANKVIEEDCKNIISKLENEIEARKKLVKSLGKNIQSINDVNAMQNMFVNINHVVNTNFDELAFYTINEEIKRVTTLKKGRYTIPTSPDKWEQANIEADFLVKESIDNRMLAEIAEEYIKSGGKYRDLTVYEGYTRGLITKTRKTVKDVIFNKEYTKNRKKNIPFDSDNIIHIPHIGDKYTFKAHVEPKFTITNKLIDTLINMDNEFQIKDRSFIELVKKVNKQIEKEIKKELGTETAQISTTLSPEELQGLYGKNIQYYKISRLDKDSNEIVEFINIKEFQEFYEKLQDYDTITYYKDTITHYKIFRLEDNSDSILIKWDRLADSSGIALCSDSIKDRCIKNIQITDSIPKKQIKVIEKREYDIIKEHLDGTSTMIFDNLPYNEKVQIVMLLDKMEETWGEDMWKEFSTSIQLKTVSAGGQNQWYFSVSAEYSQIYDGVDKEEKVYQLFNILKKDEKVLRNKEEKENIKIQIGSLEETITNGNWGE